MSANEDTPIPVGNPDENETENIRKLGIMFHFPLLIQMTLVRKNRFAMRAHLGGGFVYHAFSPDSSQNSYNSNKVQIERTRIGMGAIQTLLFWWGFRPTVNPQRRRISRWGFFAKLGIQETWTWNVDGIQTDLGHEDDTRFGTEFWPSVSLGFGLY